MSSSGSMRTLLATDVVAAARGVLGARLVSEIGGRRVVVVVTEVEAYGGTDDPASHAHRGPTARNAAMFAAAGTLYVYRAYGIHWCANIVTGESGAASAILVRSGRVVQGREAAAVRRGRPDHLADGPGKLAQALGITGAHDGLDLFEAGSPVRLDRGLPPEGITATPRIGITRATERLWRFVAG